jgi:hypothetical protein
MSYESEYLKPVQKEIRRRLAKDLSQSDVSLSACIKNLALAFKAVNLNDPILNEILISKMRAE